MTQRSWVLLRRACCRPPAWRFALSHQTQRGWMWLRHACCRLPVWWRSIQLAWWRSILIAFLTVWQPCASQAGKLATQLACPLEAERRFVCPAAEPSNQIACLPAVRLFAWCQAVFAAAAAAAATAGCAPDGDPLTEDWPASQALVSAASWPSEPVPSAWVPGLQPSVLGVPVVLWLPPRTVPPEPPGCSSASRLFCAMAQRAGTRPQR
mmetsp:Transcript_132027/g.422900  ORF Transcript_132027/g.422900 Transcript_132027/m.422900 type:complete len:209 (+) Transcript_132027:1065-1691(+)